MQLESLNTSLQGRGDIDGGMSSAVECMKKGFQSRRIEKTFNQAYTRATEVAVKLIKIQHVHKPQRRHACPAEPYVPSFAQEHYLGQFFIDTVIDTVTIQLNERCAQGELQNIVKLEKVQLSG